MKRNLMKRAHEIARSAEWKWENEFSLQVVSKGSFVDYPGGGYSYLVDTTVIRLNHIAVNDWILSENLNCRECYETDDEWEAHKAQKAAQRKAFNAKITDALGINTNNGSVCITQSQSDVFTVVYIREIK